MERISVSTALSITIAFATIFYSLCGSLTDVALLASLLVWRNWQSLLGARDVTGLAWAYEAVQAVFLSLVGYKTIRSLSTSAEKIQWDGPGRPLIVPCRTTHTRIFPKVHSFSYSYLVVGIPVGWEGGSGGMVSSGFWPDEDGLASWYSKKRKRRKDWFHVDPSDHLERGSAHLGLRGCPVGPGCRRVRRRRCDGRPDAQRAGDGRGVGRLGHHRGRDHQQPG